jgi:hypothetical protein
MQRSVVGAAFGIGAGIVLATLGVILVSGWLIAFIVPIVVPILLGAVVGFFVGRYFDRRRKPLARFWLWLLLAIVAWPLCIVGPLGARWLQIRAMIARDVPFHPDCTPAERHISVIGFDNNVGYVLKFTFSENPKSMTTFYRDSLSNAGWTALPTVTEGRYLIHQYRKHGRKLSFIIWSGIYYPDSQERNWLQIGSSLPGLMQGESKSLEDSGYKVMPPDTPIDWYKSSTGESR